MSDDDFEARIENLVARLIEKTNENKLSWSLVDDDTFEYAFTRSAVQIRSQDRDGRWPFLFYILDHQARPIDTIYEDPNSRYFQLDRLYQCASRNHRGIDKKIEEIFGELDALDDPWGPKKRFTGDEEAPF